jgi:cytochrome c-type biogenesis protein CcmH
MCVISSYLKTFIENRIREGKSSDEIVHGFQNGFKDTVDWENDSVIKHFIEEGNQGVIFNLQNGFGDKILAQPEPLWINGTLALFGIIALVGIGFYIKKMKENQSKTNTTNQNSKNLDTYLKEID